MYHWEILCLDMVKTSTKNEGQTTANKCNGAFTRCISGVKKLDDSQWKVITNNPKLVEGFISKIYWEIKC